MGQAAAHNASTEALAGLVEQKALLVLPPSDLGTTQVSRRYSSGLGPVAYPSERTASVHGTRSARKNQAEQLRKEIICPGEMLFGSVSSQVRNGQSCKREAVLIRTHSERACCRKASTHCHLLSCDANASR